MKKFSKVVLITSFCTFALSSVLKAENASSQPATQSVSQVDTSSPELKRIKGLEGRWKSNTSMFGKENEEVFTTYKITSNGSAVLERIFPDTPQEMISVYYDDENGKLTMAHYCIMKNRPLLKLSKSDKKSITMNIVKVDGLSSPEEPSMGSTTLVFKDKNRFSTTCQAQGKGMEKQKPSTMEYSRVQ